MAKELTLRTEINTILKIAKDDLVSRLLIEPQQTIKSVSDLYRKCDAKSYELAIKLLNDSNQISPP